MPPKRSDLLIHLGGECLELYGTAVSRVAPIGRGGEEFKETFARADASTLATYTDRDVAVREALANVLRVDYPLVGGVRRSHLLLEEARLNLALNSESFVAATWTPANVTVGSNALAAPDGVVSADRLTETAVTDVHEIKQIVNIPMGGSDIAFSVFARQAERTKVAIYLRNGADFAEAKFDLAAGTLIGTSVGGASVIRTTSIKASRPSDSGTVWYRIVLAARVNAGSAAIDCLVRLLDAAGSVSYLGDVTKSLFVWGAQAESTSSFPTSYFATAGSALTRAADDLWLPLPFQQQDLTIYASVARPPHADNVGDIGNWPAIVRLGRRTSSPNGAELEVVFEKTVRQVDATFWRDASNAVGVDRPMPAGDPVEVCAQFRNPATAPQVRLDVGSGFSAWSTAGTPNLTWGFYVYPAARITPTEPSLGTPLGGDLASLKIARGLWELPEMRRL